MGARCCGDRVMGGAYLRTNLAPVGSGGSPLVDFLIDPPTRVPADLDLPNRGVSVMEDPRRPGVHNVLDRVGAESYPRLTDFLAEVGVMGLSRRISKGTDFSLLTEDSIIYLAHPKAIITNAEDLYTALAAEAAEYEFYHPWICPCPRSPDHAEHNGLVDLVPLGRMGKGAPTCAGLWWETASGGEEDIWNPDRYPRTVDIEIPSCRYTARRTPDGVTPTFADGFFLRLPIHQIDVIRDPASGKHEEVAERASASGLPVVLEDV